MKLETKNFLNMESDSKIKVKKGQGGKKVSKSPNNRKNG